MAIDSRNMTKGDDDEIRQAIDEVHTRVYGILGDTEPTHLLAIVRNLRRAQLKFGLQKPITVTLTTREWWLIRFALRYAREAFYMGDPFCP